MPSLRTNGIVILFSLALQGCSQKTDVNPELSRDVAARVIGEAIAPPHAKELVLTKEGLELAIHDGLIFEDESTGPDGFVFPRSAENLHITARGFDVLGTLVSRDAKMNSGEGDNIRLLGSGENIHLAYALPLAISLGERVLRVTGVTAGSTSASRIVEFETEILLPEASDGIKKYVYIGRKGSAVLQLYDDGWRFKSEN